MSQDLLQPEIRHKLHRLRMAIRGRLLLEGLAWLCLGLVGLVLVTLAFDYTLKLDRPQRVIVMALAVGGVGYVLWRQLLAPLRVGMGEADLALLVERRFPQLGDRLIAAIQFGARGAVVAGESESMILWTAREANALAAKIEFHGIVERRGAQRMSKLAGCAVAILVGFSVWQSDVMNLWLRRNVAFSDVPWPQRTYLQVKGGPDFTIVRGDDLAIEVEVTENSVVPSEIVVHAAYPSIGATEETIARPGAGAFPKVFQAVSEPFEFYVTGGDDSRDKRRPHAVRLIDPPGIESLRFRVEYPSYMNRSPATFDGGTGVLPVPVGSWVSVTARASKDLKAVRATLEGTPLEEMRIVDVPLREGQEGGPQTPRGFAGRFRVTGKNVLESRSLRFLIEDTDGITIRRGGQYVVQLQPDLPPTVDLKKHGVGAGITSGAIVPLLISAKDDNGILAARVVVERANPSSTTRPATQTSPASRPAEDVYKANGEPERELQSRYGLDVGNYKFHEGDVIHVTAEVDDTMPPELGGPNVGRSGPLEFRIVRPEDLMAELVRRQKELRVEFTQAIALQVSTRGMTEAALGLLRGGAVTPEIVKGITDSSRVQSSVGSECVKAADTLQAILDEMMNNRVEEMMNPRSPPDYSQLSDGIISPLKGLAATIRTVAESMNAAKDVTDVKEMTSQVEKIARIQKDIQEQMEKVLQRMQKMENRQDLAIKLQMIINWSQQLQDTIRAKQEEDVRNAFEPTSKPTKPEGR